MKSFSLCASFFWDHLICCSICATPLNSISECAVLASCLSPSSLAFYFDDISKMVKFDSWFFFRFCNHRIYFLERYATAVGLLVMQPACGPRHVLDIIRWLLPLASGGAVWWTLTSMVYLQGKCCVIHTWVFQGFSQWGAIQIFVPLPLGVVYSNEAGWGGQSLCLCSTVLFYADISKVISLIPELFFDFATTERKFYTDIKVFCYLLCFQDCWVRQTLALYNIDCN